MLVFFGSSKYSIPTLEVLLKHDYKIIVVTTPDKPAGRHLRLQANPLSFFAQKNDLVIIKLSKLDQRTLKKLAGTPPRSQSAPRRSSPQNPLLGVCCVHGKIIPQTWLNYFEKGIINIHPSLLPKYRGSSPAQFALLNNEASTGITFIKMDEQCDHGPIIYQEKQPILPEDTAENIYSRLFALAAKKLPWVIENYSNGKLKPSSQDHSQASFTQRLKKEDGLIKKEDLKKALTNKKMAELIDRKRRALTPWPGIYTEISLGGKTKRLKILKTHLEKNKLVIDEVQLEGKRPVTFWQFSSSYSEIF